MHKYIFSSVAAAKGLQGRGGLFLSNAAVDLRGRHAFAFSYVSNSLKKKLKGMRNEAFDSEHWK